MEDLLNNFTNLLDQYNLHREYIKRARAHAEKFPSEIVGKVVLDHEIKSSTVADEVLPLVPQLEGHIATIDAEKTGIVAQKAAADEQMQELQLRHIIGEMTEDEFNEASSDLRASLDEANNRLEALDSDRGTLSEALDRWVSLASDADQATGLSTAEPEPVAEPEPEPALVSEPEPVLVSEPEPVLVSEPEPEPVLVLEPEPEPVLVSEPELDLEPEIEVELDADVVLEAGPDELSVDSEQESAVRSFEAIAEEPDGIHASYGGREDLSGVLPRAEPPAMVALEPEPEPIIAAMDVELDDGDEDSIDALGLSDEDLDDVGEIGISIDELDPEPIAAPMKEEPRRALLLYQEGTAEEQIYPFTGDVLTVGRGRDNDIQIKNDSKVSRFHCKMFRRSSNFYIEDNKSSNGTLVNGELITERRLFGGEEIVIGETYFRFRIM